MARDKLTFAAPPAMQQDSGTGQLVSTEGVNGETILTWVIPRHWIPILAEQRDRFTCLVLTQKLNDRVIRFELMGADNQADAEEKAAEIWSIYIENRHRVDFLRDGGAEGVGHA